MREFEGGYQQRLEHLSKEVRKIVASPSSGALGGAVIEGMIGSEIFGPLGTIGGALTGGIAGKIVDYHYSSSRQKYLHKEKGKL